MQAAIQLTAREFDEKAFRQIKNFLPDDALIEIVILPRPKKNGSRKPDARQRLLKILAQTPRPQTDLTLDEQLALVDQVRTEAYGERVGL